jgi:hypothetical protein
MACWHEPAAIVGRHDAFVYTRFPVRASLPGNRLFSKNLSVAALQKSVQVSAPAPPPWEVEAQRHGGAESLVFPARGHHSSNP